MNGFVKTSDSPIVLSGAQKAAVLLAEIGSADSKMLERLALTPEQTKKLNAAFRSLGTYNPYNVFHAKREGQVLEEMLNNLHFAYPQLKAEKNGEIKEKAKMNPDQVAEVLKVWLNK